MNIYEQRNLARMHVSINRKSNMLKKISQEVQSDFF